MNATCQSEGEREAAKKEKKESLFATSSFYFCESVFWPECRPSITYILFSASIAVDLHPQPTEQVSGRKGVGAQRRRTGRT